MPGLRILIADDQLPDDDLSEKEFRQRFFSQYPKNAHNQGFLKQCMFMRTIVQALRDAGYRVTTARVHSDAKAKIRNSAFDLAIIDLGWFMDASLNEADRPAAGWALCDELDDEDKRLGRKTPQILFSSRFPSEPELSREAARRQKLPVFKEPTDTSRSALLATVAYVETTLKTQAGVSTLLPDNQPARNSELLPYSSILEVHEAALACGLNTLREVLVGGLDRAVVASMPTTSTTAGQILSDLQYLNRLGTLPDGSIPLTSWLATAAALSAKQNESSVFQAKMAALFSRQR